MSTVTYLDHAATTPMRREAIEAMLPYLDQQFANPSGSHRFARQARAVIDDARDRVAHIIGCAPGEVVFTGGGTESDNTAIRGVVARRGGRPLCAAAEHHAVLEPVEAHHGVVAPVGADGSVRLDRLGDLLCQHPDVSVVSVMAVNNEVGTITPMADVAAVVRRVAPQAVLHTDAVQAATWLDLRPLSAMVDMLSLSAHKFGGPKGVGVLMAREGVLYAPLLLGGGQERERRSGTHNVAGIVALATALEAADAERLDVVQRVAGLRDRLLQQLAAAVDGVHVTVEATRAVPGCVHVCIEGIENEALLFLLDEADVCASAASACAAGAMEPSHVLAAMGVPRHLGQGAVRLSLGRVSTEADVDRGVAAIVDAVQRLRRPR